MLDLLLQAMGFKHHSEEPSGGDRSVLHVNDCGLLKLFECFGDNAVLVVQVVAGELNFWEPISYSHY